MQHEGSAQRGRLWTGRVCKAVKGGEEKKGRVKAVKGPLVTTALAATAAAVKPSPPSCATLFTPSEPLLSPSSILAF